MTRTATRADRRVLAPAGMSGGRRTFSAFAGCGVRVAAPGATRANWKHPVRSLLVFVAVLGLAGAVAAVVLLYVLLRLSTNPEPLPSRRTAESWLWGGLVGLVGLACVALALWSAYHGLMDGTPLPAPDPGGAS